MNILFYFRLDMEDMAKLQHLFGPKPSTTPDRLLTNFGDGHMRLEKAYANIVAVRV
jgi:hypothetical protein